MIFPQKTIIPYQDFLHGNILFHLDKPDPDPIERETITNPIQKNKYPAGLDSKILMLYTTASNCKSVLPDAG